MFGNFLWLILPAQAGAMAVWTSLRSRRHQTRICSGHTGAGNWWAPPTTQRKQNAWSPQLFLKTPSQSYWIYKQATGGPLCLGLSQWNHLIYLAWSKAKVPNVLHRQTLKPSLASLRLTSCVFQHFLNGHVLGCRAALYPSTWFKAKSASEKKKKHLLSSQSSH